ncbi:hypothetical protein D5018_12345 [Parashewanella curva]|uniref:Uncharacterized protein n=1 Tax=Parashewanella curva TaxID=2338552 RepID=A0A3L8PV97_9GAMM|nr:hypothetical protein [Parashewanella curva]RLV59357.1 hypothetical protein D5018_12345 [Parashewanella curva]
MLTNRPFTPFNKISDSQIKRLAQVTKLSEKSLEHFILQLEFFFDDLGKLPINSEGEIDLPNRENHAKRLRDKLRQIKDLSKQLKKEVDIYNLEVRLSDAKSNNNATLNYSVLYEGGEITFEPAGDLSPHFNSEEEQENMEITLKQSLEEGM